MHMYCWILSKLLFYMFYNIRHCFVGLCRIMSDFVERYVHCIQYIFHGILHTIYIPFVYCIHYYSLIKMYTIFFPYSLDKVHFIYFANFISNILIPLKSQVKTLKKIFFLFFLDLCFKVCLCICIFIPVCQALKHS